MKKSISRVVAAATFGCLAAGSVVVVTAGTGSAAGGQSLRLVGNARANDLIGTRWADHIDGRGGNDDIYGRGGNDTIIPGPGADDVFGGPGNDLILAVDGREDDISCGTGQDVVHADPIDDVSRNCETVHRSGGGTAPTAPSGSAISSAEAGRIAAAHVGGRVDDIERDNDYGAYWEVDVYAPNGEYTIYVSATGQIVKVEGPFR